MAIPGGPNIAITPTVLQALRDLADAMGDAEEALAGSAEAAQYLLILTACTSVLDAAPRTAAECGIEQIEQRLIDSLVRLVSTAASLFPGGIEEMFYYLSKEQQRHFAWGSNSPIAPLAHS